MDTSEKFQALLQSYSSCCAKHCDANGKTDLDKARFDFGKILAEMSNDEWKEYLTNHAKSFHVQAWKLGEYSEEQIAFMNRLFWITVQDKEAFLSTGIEKLKTMVPSRISAEDFEEKTQIYTASHRSWIYFLSETYLPVQFRSLELDAEDAGDTFSLNMSDESIKKHFKKFEKESEERRSAKKETTEPTDSTRLAPNTRVELHGLTSAKGSLLNGKLGRTVGAADVTTKRITVILDEVEVEGSANYFYIKPENLKLSSTSSPRTSGYRGVPYLTKKRDEELEELELQGEAKSEANWKKRTGQVKNATRSGEERKKLMKRKAKGVFPKNQQESQALYQLGVACATGNLSETKRLVLREHVNPNMEIMGGMFPLLLACQGSNYHAGAIKCILWLIQHDANPWLIAFRDATPNNSLPGRTGALRQTAMFRAVSDGTLPLVKMFVEQIGPISILWEFRDDTDKNALQYAVEFGHLNVVQYLVKQLIKHGHGKLREVLANQNMNGLNCIHLGCSNGRTEALTLFHRALKKKKKKSKEKSKETSKEKSKEKSREKSTATAEEAEEAEEGKSTLIDSLFFQQDDGDIVPLQYAIMRGHQDTVRKMLAWGVPKIDIMLETEAMLTGMANVDPTSRQNNKRVPAQINRNAAASRTSYLEIASMLDRRSCDHCNKSSKKALQKCSRCKIRNYCSAECQTQSWKAGHKKECKQLQAKRKEAERKGGDALENFREVHQYKSLMKGLAQCRQAGLLGQDER